MKKITIFENNAVLCTSTIEELPSGKHVIGEIPMIVGDAIYMADPAKEVVQIRNLIEGAVNQGRRSLEHGDYLWTWNIRDSREKEV